MFAWLKNLFSRPVSSCSFCWKQSRELVEGRGEQRVGGVFICRDCAQLAVGIFDKRSTSGAMQS